MPRIAGVDVPANKKILFALQYVYGIGMKSAAKILVEAKIDPDLRAHKLSEGEVAGVAKIIEQKYRVEGELRREIGENIKRLKDLGTYRGSRHIRKLPVRGQRTHTNARVRKGHKRVAIAGKKIVAK